MTVYGYARVSTEGQSLEAQIEELTNAGAKKIYQEKQSGKNMERKELQRVLKMLRYGDVLLVTRMDRLARSTLDLLNMIDLISKKGAQFKSLREPLIDTTTAHGRLITSVLAALAAFERELIIARTHEGRKRAIERGVKMGPKFRLTDHQQREALRRHQEGEMQSDIAKSYNVSPATICRLMAAQEKFLTT